MSTTVALTNLRSGPLAHPEFAAVAALATKSKLLKQVNADDYSGRYDALAAFGVAVSENGVLRPGSHLVTDSIYTQVAADKCIVIDLLAVTRVITLAVSGTLTQGALLYVLLRSTTGGQATITAGAGDTILTLASVPLSTAGAVLRLKLVGTDWVAQ
jgi:hypothetical protein